MKRVMHLSHAFLVASCIVLVSCSTGQGVGAESISAGIAEGWQMQVPPMSKLSAGTIYRKDPQGAIYRVTTLSVQAEKVEEGGFEYKAKLRTTANLLARFIGIGGITGQLDKEVQVLLEMKDVMRQITDDQRVDQAVKKFWEDVEIRPKSKYYIIRETRAASRVNLHLAREAVAEIGGEATLKKIVGVGSNLKQGDQGSIIVHESYGRRMHVMFLPEEIKVSSAGLSGEPPTFGRFPVKEVLGWSLDPEAQ